MENVLSIIYTILPVLHVLLIAGLITKIILMTGFRNFDLPYLVSSYFRFYDKDDNNNTTSNPKRKLYVVMNNYINYYTYFWVLICLICLLAFGNAK